MIPYLVLSTLSMGLLLIFYHAVLEKEKIYHINRGYLIFSLIFSLIIPVLPVGLFSSMLPWSAPETLQTHADRHLMLNQLTAPAESPQPTGRSLPFPAIVFWGFITIYCIVTAGLLVRFLRIIHIIQTNIRRHRATLRHNVPVVLLSQQVVPHTFLKTIFVNRHQFERGEITPEILRHEFTHARQLHSLDILFVELLKIVMWFNPVLYFYKKAMLLNHEFLADDAVLSTGSHIKTYQQLLFNYSHFQFSHQLSISFSYSLSPKREFL